MSKDKPREAVAGALARLHLEAGEKLEEPYAPYERALGVLSIRFSLLHSLLEQLAWEVWGMNMHVAAIITKDLPTKHLVNKLRDTTKLVIFTKEGRKLLSILNRTEKVADRRNEYLHSIWIIRKGQPTFCLSRKRGRLVGPEAPTAEDINDLSRNIMNIVADFMEFKDGKTLERRIWDFMKETS